MNQLKISMPSWCKYENNGTKCTKYASYNFPGEKSRIYCKKHANPEMIINRKDSRICTHLDHKNQTKIPRASFNYPNQTHPLFCKTHSEEGMINLNNKNNMCKDCGQKQPSYGPIGKKATHCAKCATKDMVDVVSNLCSAQDCQTNATYGIHGQKAKYCKFHSLDYMIPVKNARCKSCGIFTVSKKPNLCAYCKPSSTLHQKTKEMKVVNYLEEKGFDFTHNKSVGFVCGNYRPDIRIDAGTHFIIVEIDENQHSQYDQSCEIVRMYNIFQAEGIQCIFLRYNPDIFRDGKQKAIIVRETTRLNVLVAEIEKHMTEPPEEDISVYRLFYNNPVGVHVQKYDIESKYMKMIDTLL